uniref:Nfu_N domain-containing protein n=1 Tax=Onchocerca flexuosa TaxID=387005 RepID=A0A183HPH4_9BILA
LFISFTKKRYLSALSLDIYGNYVFFFFFFCREAPTSELQIIANTSRGNQDSAFIRAQKKPIKNLVEKLYRPQTSLTGSFTVDQDEDTVTLLEPVRILTFQDTTMDDTVGTKDNLDRIINSSKKENVAAVHISEPPVLKSELAKQWIREVARKVF